MLKKSPVANYQSLITKRGFTLIELLVVISIIGILAGLTLSSYSGAQKQARDSQRRSDLNQYRNALEAYAASNGGKYPSSGGASTCTSVSDICGTTYFSPFISSCPQDPKFGGGQQYNYCADTGGALGSPTSYKYRLYVNGGLETGGTWVVCYDGKAGKVNNDWSSVYNYCPF